MALPRATFNSKNVDFTKRPYVYEVHPYRSRVRALSASGLSDTLNVASGYSVLIRFRSFASSSEADLKTSLYELAQWAESGALWTFAFDRDITVSTTLDTAEAAGSTSLGVASATGITSGRRYALESLTQVATVKATNSATDPVTIAVGLDNAFASGDRFREYDYFPMLGSVRVIEQPPDGNLFHVEISGFVDKRALA